MINMENILKKYGIKFFTGICKDCVNNECIIKNNLPINIDMISQCNYFTTVKKENDHED